MSDLIISGIRTGVPLAVAALVRLLLGIGIEVDTGTQEALILGLSGLITLGYYALVRWAERRWPKFGVLLGWKATPTYLPADVVATVDPSGSFRAGPASEIRTGKVVADEATLAHLRHPITYNGTEGH